MKILEALAERKFSLYLDYMDQSLPAKGVPVDVVNAIIFLLRLFRVIECKQAYRIKMENYKRKVISEKIKQKHKIKSLYTPYFNLLVEE